MYLLIISRSATGILVQSYCFSEGHVAHHCGLLYGDGMVARRGLASLDLQEAALTECTSPRMYLYREMF